MSQDKYRIKLEEYLNALDLPKWYLGFSDYQEGAITELCNDLRDDFEQGTSFRVEKSLVRLGLSPLVSKKKIRTMVQLSRGNDLAFLFFILEGYYKSSQKNTREYTTNEKLLMVAISKLDLLPTLRELDQLLPPPQKTAFNQKRGQSNVKTLQTAAKTASVKGSIGSSSNATSFPYFQRQPRPKEIHINYVSKPSDLVAEFPFWPLGKPPNYGKISEPPWFAEYNLNPVGRLVKSTVGEAVDKYFNSLNQMTILHSKSRSSRRGSASQKAARDNSEESPMCAYHKFAVGDAQSVKDELTVLARDRCLELMDITLPYRKLRQKRIVNQLEREIDECMKRYQTKMESTTVHTLAKDDCVLCQEQRIDLPAAMLHDRKGRALVGDNLHLEHTEAIDNCVGTRLSGGGLRMDPVDFEGAEGLCQALDLDMNAAREVEQPSCLPPKGKSQNRISFLLDDSKLKKLRSERKESSVEVQFQGKQTKKTFFVAPTAHKPYQFKYKRIFKSGQEKPRDVKKVIAKALIHALEDSDDEEEPVTECTKQSDNTSDDFIDKEVSGIRLTDSCGSINDTSDHSMRSHEDHRADIVNAVVRCAKQMWMKNVNIKRIEMEAKETERRKSNQEAPRAVTAGDEPLDPDNSQLMNRLLEDGLLQLRKNQRYVLASLPDAHKLPVLREWIKRRYGKKYSEEDVENSIHQSTKVFELITLLQNSAPATNMMGLDRLPKSKENFANWKEIKALAAKVKEEYYKKLNDEYMNHMTACWVAMGNYMCRGGPPKKPFFAYMSANTRDIMRNKVWSGEFRNIRQLRDVARQKN